MREDLEKRLLEDFPDLYYRLLDINGWQPFHISCSSGWEPLLRRLSERITHIVQSLPLESPTSVVDRQSISKDTRTKARQYTGLTAKSFCVIQVKEKFGGLRFYMSESTSEIELAIQDAEEESLTTCETCGRSGKLRGGPWYIVACDEHNCDNEEVIKFSV
jgi:hypothetical protein